MIQVRVLMSYLLLTFVVFMTLAGTAYSQVTGVPPSTPDMPESAQGSDSVYVFTPARPLIDTNRLRTALPQAFGLNVLFSNSGYGLGFFYERKFSQTLSGFFDLAMNGARKGDELEVFNRDPNSVHYLTYYVPNKVNRVYHMPLMIGVKKNVFGDALFNNFRPFFSVGVGGTLIMTTPYNKEFFSAFGDASFDATYGGFVGFGAELSERSPGIAFSARYYYLPKEPGVESVVKEPITDFGGLFLTLNVPF